MASPALFRYLDRPSPVHALDPRAKLACLALLGAGAALSRSVAAFACAGALTGAALVCSQLPARHLADQARPFVALAAAVMLASLFLTPGAPLSEVRLPLGGAFGELALPDVPGASAEGLRNGAAAVGRIALAVALCSLVLGTTTPLSLRRAVEWYLRPAPFVSEARAAASLSLSLSLVPVLFDAFGAVRDAQLCRCGDLRRNPLDRLRLLMGAFARGTLRRADRIADAMEARCYSDERTRPLFRGRPSDLAAVGVCACAALACALL